MANGTEAEITEQLVKVDQLEQQLAKAKLRLRALKGDALLQVGDSFPSISVEEAMAELQAEFGSRNLRVF